MSAKKLKNYSGLYGELDADASPFYVYSELIEDRSGLFDWTIEPHLHAHLYQFFLVQAGKASVDTTSGAYDLRPPGVVIIPPGTVHGFRYDPTVKGRIVTVADTVLEGLAKELPNILLTLKNFSIVDDLKDGSLFTDLIDLAVRIEEENSGRQPEKDFALQSWLQILVIKLYRLLALSHTPTNTLSLNEKYFLSFQNSLKASAPFSKGVADYAHELSITPVHLNRVCQSVAGKTASWLMQEHAVREAQKLLRYTVLSVSEIAYQLNFSAPTYFARLFKKHIGKTPEAYRKS